MASTSTAKTVNDDRWNQAVLTRFQQKVLGLTRELHGDAIRKCPKNPCTVEEVIIVSLKVAIVRESETGAITRVNLAYTSFDTARLKSARPQDFSKIILHEKSWSESAWEIEDGDLRPVSLALIDIFEPSCVDPNGDIVPDRERSSAEDYDVRRFEHLQHLDCGRRKRFLLLLPKKTEGLESLKVLGFAPHKHLHIVDVVSARLLLRSHLKRTGQTTKPQPSLEDVWSVGECPSTLVGGDMRMTTLATLLATVKITIKDASSAAATGSTYDEVDAKPFFGLQRKLESWEDKKAFLLEWNLSVEGLVPQAEAKEFVKRVTSMPVPLGDNSDESAVKRARLYNYEELLLESPSAGSRGESSSCSTLITSTAQKPQATAATSTEFGSVPSQALGPVPKHSVAQQTQASASSSSSSTSSTSSFTSSTTSVPSTGQVKAKIDPPKPKWTPSLNEKLPYELGIATWQYKRLTHDFLEGILQVVQSDPKVKQALSTEIQAKVDHIIGGTHAERQEDCELCDISCHEYVRLAQALDPSSPWGMALKQDLMDSLDKMISKREEVSAWYLALPKGDERREGNDSHIAFIYTMREVKNILWSASVC